MRRAWHSKSERPIWPRLDIPTFPLVPLVPPGGRKPPNPLRNLVCKGYLVPPMRDLNGKRAVVTGAAAGIGRAIALELARAGCRLFLIDRDGEALARVGEEARALHAEAQCRVADLSDAAQTAAA